MMHNKKLIARRLLLHILLASSFLTLLITTFQLYIDYRNDLNSIEIRLHQINESYSETLALGLWDLDKAQVDNMLKGILKFSDIQYLEVESINGNIFAKAGTPQESKVILARFPVVYDNTKIGMLHISATLAGVYQRLQNKVLLVLGSQGIKTFLISIFILSIIHYLIIRHLISIGMYVQGFNLDKTEKKLALDRPKNKEPDELDNVVNAFNEMQERIRLDLETQIMTEMALRESEQKFKSIFENAPLAIVHFDKIGTTTACNDNLCRILGTSKETLIGFNTLERLKDEIMLSSLTNALAGKKSHYEGNYVSVTGSVPIPLSAYFAPILSVSGEVTGAMGILEDITHRLEAEKALSQEKERLLVTLRSIGDGVITTDTSGRVGLINKVAEKLTGWTQAEASGKDIKDVFNIINAKTRQPCENPVEKVLETKIIIGLANHTNLIARDGTERMVADSGAPIFDANSEIIGVVLVFRDVTEKYKIEKQLQQAQKMESIGTLAGGIAHDFNNMLGVITGNISYILSNFNEGDELFGILSDVQEGATQAQNLTHQLLTFARGGAPIKKVKDINRIITESATFSIRGANANCHLELSNDLWPAEVDEGQINQVIGNLVINANQAMPNGGTITIKTENSTIDSEAVVLLPAGRYIKIIVEDQGIGITTNHLQNIFDPYFTTKQKGSGLGLATTYSIIKKHDGHITVYSELESGTVFCIYLPASLKDMKRVEKIKDLSHKGYGKVLIMDDQEPILKMAGRMINKMGYDAEFATDGVKAIEMYRVALQAKRPYDLVILDLTVPGGMGGAKTVIELLKNDPNVKAVVSSGYSNDPIMANYQDYGFFSVVPKPYTKNQLAELFNKIFGENR